MSRALSPWLSLFLSCRGRSRLFRFIFAKFVSPRALFMQHRLLFPFLFFSKASPPNSVSNCVLITFRECWPIKPNKSIRTDKFIACGSDEKKGKLRLTGHFTIIEPQNPLINVSELYKTWQSKLYKRKRFGQSKAIHKYTHDWNRYREDFPPPICLMLSRIASSSPWKVKGKYCKMAKW